MYICIYVYIYIYITKKNDYVSKKFIKNYILNTKTKFSASCHNLLQSA